MRQKRTKAYRKLMSLYGMTFGFRQPYQVLIDSEFCKTSITHKIEVVKQLGIVLQGNVKPMITQCCIHELYLQGKEQQSAVDLAKTFERRKCNHRETIPGDECLAGVVGDLNKHRYVIASQSRHLRGTLRAIPGVPLVHITRSVMILEPPSDATLKAKQANEEQGMLPSMSETKTLAAAEQPAEAPRKKRKGPKGPNPLSVKKKKPKNAERGPEASSKRAICKNEGEVEPDGTSQKRKRTDEDGEQPASEGLGRKRKRRRKTAPGKACNAQDRSEIEVADT